MLGVQRLACNFLLHHMLARVLHGVVMTKGLICSLLELSSAQWQRLDGHLSELHLIAGQGASLITEDVLHLAQVLIQVAVTCLCILSTYGILHCACSFVVLR